MVNLRHFTEGSIRHVGGGRVIFSKGSLALVIKLHSTEPVPQIKNLSLSGIYHNALLSAGAFVYLKMPVCACVCVYQ